MREKRLCRFGFCCIVRQVNEKFRPEEEVSSTTGLYILSGQRIVGDQQQQAVPQPVKKFTEGYEVILGHWMLLWLCFVRVEIL